MKNTISIVLVAVMFISLCSCSVHSKEDEYNEFAKKCGYQSLFGVSYGMPIKEVKKSLNVTDEEFKEYMEPEKYYAYENIEQKIYETKVLYKDKPASAFFLFIHNTKSEILTEFILNEIIIVFDEVTPVRDVYNELDKELTTNNFNYQFGAIGHMIKFTNSKKIADFDDEKIKNILKEPKKLLGEEYISLGEDSFLDQVTINYEVNSNDVISDVSSIKYSGTAAAVLAALSVSKW